MPIQQYYKIIILIFSLILLSCENPNKSELTIDNNEINDPANIDILTPEYFQLNNEDFIEEINNFVYFAQKDQFHHPLKDKSGQIPDYSTPQQGEFGSIKNGVMNHVAVDMHPANNRTNISIYAAHNGYVNIFRNAPKYRDYLTITKDIIDDKGILLGKLVTIYAHLDLSQPILNDNDFINKGDLIEQKLYSDTIGGPHLHFEVRYYRFSDSGIEEFYGLKSSLRTIPSANGFIGYWEPDVGYGFGNPKNHGIE